MEEKRKAFPIDNVKMGKRGILRRKKSVVSETRESGHDAANVLVKEVAHGDPGVIGSRQERGEGTQEEEARRRREGEERRRGAERESDMMQFGGHAHLTAGDDEATTLNVADDGMIDQP